MKHIIIKEIIFECEYRLNNCLVKESYTPMKYQTYKESEKQARNNGWSVIKGKTCCIKCKQKLDEEENERNR